MVLANSYRAFVDPDVAEAYMALPPAPREKLLQVRELIFDTAMRTVGVGNIVETLKWGEPSYLSDNRSGTTVRIHWKARTPNHCALYVPCQTDLLDQFRALKLKGLELDGKRAVLFPLSGRLPVRALRKCVALAHTYRLKK